MDQKKDQQNVTFVDGIMSITLEYRYARIKTFIKSAPKNLEKIPLYISFEEDLINFLNDTAFLSSYNCIPLMKSEEQLKQLLTELWDSPSPCMNPRFPSLTPGLLWCAVIYRLIDRGLEKLKPDGIKCVGIFISYPDFADTSLKKLIINAVRNYDEQNNQEKKIGIKVFPNSRGAAARWPYFDRVNLSGIVNDSYKQEFRGYLVYEINSTEFYLTLGRMKSGIVVGKGKINIGMNSSFREVLKLANVRNGKLQNSIKPIEEWDHRLKQFLEGFETSLCSFNSNADTINFNDMGNTKQPVKKTALVKAIEEDMEKISKMVLNTIQETIEKLTNLDTLKLNGYTFDLKNLSRDKYTQYICVLMSNKNDGFLENKLNSEKMSTLIPNELGDTLGIGCTYFARGFLSRLTNSKTDNHTNFILGDEVTLCELIQANRFLIKDKKDNEITTFPREPILSIELIPVGTELEKYVEYKLYDTFNSNDRNQYFYIGKFTLLHEGDVYIQLNKYLANLLPRVGYGDPRDQYNELDSDLIFVEEEINKNEKKYKQYIQEGEIQEEFISFGKYPDILLKLIDKIASDQVGCTSIKSDFGKLKTYTPSSEKQVEYYYTKEREMHGISKEEKADFEKFPLPSVYNNLFKDLSYTASGDPIVFREKILEFWKPLVMRMDRINAYLTKNDETSQMYKLPRYSKKIIDRYKKLIEESKENKEAKE